MPVHVTRNSGRPAILARRHAAASGHYLATEAAMRMFRLGGNAIDAGVAAGIVIDVVLPDQCSFGGVAPIIVYDATHDEVVSISGLGRWGRRARREHFVEHEHGEIPFGVKRSIVPAAPDAWLTALARYGRLPLADVLRPAVELAEGGFVVHRTLNRNLQAFKPTLSTWPSSAAIFLPGGDAVAEGSVFRQPDLARTFKRLIGAAEAVSGGRAAQIEAARDEFYRGSIARQIAEFIGEQGGFVDEEDLADFHVELEEPPHVSFNGDEVYTSGFWSQGPVLAQVLNIVEAWPLEEIGHNTAEYIHLVVEAFKLAFADRERYYGDPGFNPSPFERLLSKEYAEERRRLIDETRAVAGLPVAGDGSMPNPLDGTIVAPAHADADTSYVCAVDEDGNAFSATPSDAARHTPIVPGLGLICSGRGSQSWLIPGHAAEVGPTRRPRLTPNPAMAFRNGRLLMPFGTPGGDMQTQAMLQTYVNMRIFGMDVQEAIEAPRFSTWSFPNSFWPHEYLPGRVRLEGRIDRRVGDRLAARGHDVEWLPEWSRSAGNMCAITVDPDSGALTAGADARAEAYASGW